VPTNAYQGAASPSSGAIRDSAGMAPASQVCRIAFAKCVTLNHSIVCSGPIF
jgi:hypothetical protein